MRKSTFSGKIGRQDYVKGKRCERGAERRGLRRRGEAERGAGGGGVGGWQLLLMVCLVCVGGNFNLLN
jgi:hypothetical protein